MSAQVAPPLEMLALISICGLVISVCVHAASYNCVPMQLILCVVRLQRKPMCL